MAGLTCDDLLLSRPRASPLLQPHLLSYGVFGSSRSVRYLSTLCIYSTTLKRNSYALYLRLSHSQLNLLNDAFSFGAN
jgi:hypothetical protein